MAIPEENTQLVTQCLSLLDELLHATSHYGYKTPTSENYWEDQADQADGKTSDDVRRSVWTRARVTLDRLNHSS